MGYLGLTGAQDFSHGLGGFTSGLVHVEGEDDLIEGLNPLKVFLDFIDSALGTVLDGHHRPAVVLELGYREGVNLALGDDKTSTTCGPKPLAIQRGTMGVSAPAERLVLEPQFLSDQFSVDEEVGHLYGLAVVIGDRVPELLARLHLQLAGTEALGLTHRNQGFRHSFPLGLLLGDGVGGWFVVVTAHPEAVGVAVGVAGEVVFGAALGARLLV